MKEIKHIKVEKDMKVLDLVESMGNIGFGAKKISKASLIMKDMFEDKDCRVFLGLAGDLFY